VEHRAQPPSAPLFFSPRRVALSGNIYNTTVLPVRAGRETLKAQLGLLFTLS